MLRRRAQRARTPTARAISCAPRRATLLEQRDFPTPWRRDAVRPRRRDRDAGDRASTRSRRARRARRRMRTTTGSRERRRDRALSRRAPRAASRCAAATTTGSRRSCVDSLGRATFKAHWKGNARRSFGEGSCRATRCSPSASALRGGARRVHRARRRRPRARCCTRSCAGASTTYERRQAARRRARLPRPAARARATCCATTPTCAPSSSARFTHSSSTSSRTPIRCRPRSCCSSRPTIPRETRLAARRAACRASCSSSAIRSSRSTASAAPTSRSTRRVKRSSLARGADAGAPHARASAALPAIQRAVNAAFAPLMHGDRRRRSRRATCRSSAFARGSRRPAGVVALPVPRPYSELRQGHQTADRGLAARRGRRLRRLAGRRERLDGYRARRPDAARRRSSRATSASSSGASRASATTSRARYVRALEARRIPHVLVGGRSFHEREEVHALRNALCAIEWPDDELRVFATLRGAVLRARRRRAARLTGSACRHVCIRSASRRGRRSASAGARRRRGARAARGAPPPAQPPAHRRDLCTQLLEATRAHAGIAHLADRRAGARQRAARRRPGAPLRGRRRDRRSAPSSSGCGSEAERGEAARRPSSRRAPRACAS